MKLIEAKAIISFGKAIFPSVLRTPDFLSTIASVILQGPTPFEIMVLLLLLKGSSSNNGRHYPRFCCSRKAAQVHHVWETFTDHIPNTTHLGPSSIRTHFGSITHPKPCMMSRKIWFLGQNGQKYLKTGGKHLIWPSEILTSFSQKWPSLKLSNIAPGPLIAVQTHLLPHGAHFHLDSFFASLASQILASF